MARLFELCVFACAITLALGSACSNPKATVTAFSAHDATILTQMAHIAEITIKCSNKDAVVPLLFAEFACGKIVPLARLGENVFQVSWTEEVKSSSGGKVAVRLLDEEGYSSVRKAQREGEKTINVKSVVDIIIPTESSYNGPWIRAEILAALIIGALAYFAFDTKSKVQA